ncbi:hypothetical protein SO802_000918, partial [Lithocarpus litseifolius]
LDLSWRPPRLVLNFHSVSATTTVATSSLAGKAPFEGCSSGRIGIRTCSSKLKWIIRRCSTNAFVVVDDEKYGNKQIILRQLREETASLRGSQMHVFIISSFLCMFYLYIGYSSLAVALVLPESGRLVACERDAKALEVAKKYYERAGVLHKEVDVKYGLAADVLKSLILNGEACRDDLIPKHKSCASEILLSNFQKVSISIGFSVGKLRLRMFLHSSWRLPGCWWGWRLPGSWRL